jgi:hypothetical protein
MKANIFSFFVGAVLALIVQPLFFPDGFLSAMQQGVYHLLGR